jgi:hypothetical protein
MWWRPTPPKAEIKMPIILSPGQWGFGVYLSKNKVQEKIPD